MEQIKGRYFAVRLTKEQHAAAKRRAKIGGQSISAWVREAICSAAGIPVSAARNKESEKGVK